MTTLEVDATSAETGSDHTGVDGQVSDHTADVIGHVNAGSTGDRVGRSCEAIVRMECARGCNRAGLL